jgi:hypothetical protein
MCQEHQLLKAETQSMRLGETLLDPGETRCLWTLEKCKRVGTWHTILADLRHARPTAVFSTPESGS